jgi:hypothetical protein
MFVTEKRARIGRFLLTLGVTNFVAYCIIAECLGGDAVNGHAADGHWFLASHGQLTEVTHAAFLYSKVHTYSVWITIPLAMAGSWVDHLWRQRNP